jgi:hypothetical protein
MGIRKCRIDVNYSLDYSLIELDQVRIKLWTSAMAVVKYLRYKTKDSSNS